MLGRDEVWNENSVERMNERKENSERNERNGRMVKGMSEMEE